MKFWRFLKSVYYNENMNTVKIRPWINKSYIFWKFMKSEVCFVFTACSESLISSRKSCLKFYWFLKSVYYNENMNAVKIRPWINKSCVLTRKLKKIFVYIDLWKLPKNFEFSRQYTTFIDSGTISIYLPTYVVLHHNR